jgi:hypothetical protein
LELECYPMTATPPDLIPGRQSRNWMDAFISRHPYRCLPLNMANTTGWEIMCSGSPNHVKDGIQPLVGLIETDWLPFPFTMNWIFTRPGRIKFEKGEPFCFITLTEHKKVEQFQPVIRTLESNPVMKGQFEAWNRQRTDFNTRLASGDPDAAKEAWQRFYFKGELPEDLGAAPETHSNKRRLKMPRVG